MFKLNTLVLIGGSGTNLQYMIDGCDNGFLDIEIQAVISHNPEAYGLVRAEQAQIPALTVDHRAFKNRAEFESQLARVIGTFEPDLIVLAGFMRILSAEFIHPYLGKIINIHPSRLPDYPGLNTHKKVLEAKNKIHGATVHYVTSQLDGGPIIAQTTIDVEENDTESSLKAKVQLTEYDLYPKVIQWFAEHRLHLDNNVVYFDEQPLPQTGIQLNNETAN